MTSKVSRVPAARPQAAQEHFAALLAYETDCADVHHAISTGHQDFVLFDVRSEQLFESGHVPGAVSMPHWKMSEEALSAYAADTLFVVYCAGPHCNGADKAAHKLASFGRPVKKMIGGVTGWEDEGLSLVTD
jgi:rhodanese-related sulfurtransferase